jgi:hypothetical protein
MDFFSAPRFNFNRIISFKLLSTVIANTINMKQKRIDKLKFYYAVA